MKLSNLFKFDREISMQEIEQYGWFYLAPWRTRKVLAGGGVQYKVYMTLRGRSGYEYESSMGWKEYRVYVGSRGKFTYEEAEDIISYAMKQCNSVHADHG